MSEAGVFPRPGGGVDLVLDIAGASLFADRAGDEGAASPASETAPEPVILEIYAYALDAEGGVRGFLTEAFRLDDPEQIRSLATGGVKFLGRMALGSGNYSLRLLVLQRRADRFALMALPFTIPGEAMGTASAPGPSSEPSEENAAPEVAPAEATVPFMMLEPAAPWILVRQPERGQMPPVSGGPPWSDGGGWWVPAVHPVVGAGDDLQVFFVGEAPAIGRLLDAEDRQPVYEADLVIENPTPAVGGFHKARLPASNLEAGEYLLQTGGGEAPAQALSLVAGGAPMPWFVPRAGATDRVGELLAETSSESHERLDDRSSLKRAYAKALLPLSGETPLEALASVADFERGQVGDGSQKRMAQLLEAEAQIALQAVIWSEGETQVLLPLLWLHEQLYRGYHHRGEYLLSVHSRQLVARIGELYVQRDKTPHRAPVDIAVLTSNMAGYLQEIGSNLAARQAFEHALELDGDNVAALLGLAVIHEAYGDYARALDPLRRLVKLRPNSAEARLRLGINLRRTGALRPAAEELEICVAPGQPTWVRSLAFQELAALEDGAGRPAEAVAWLRRGLAELPGEQRPRLQLASLLDRLGHPAEATALVEGMSAELVGSGPTARFRYGRWPRWALLETYRRFETRVLSGMPGLVLAVERMNGLVPMPGDISRTAEQAEEEEGDAP